MKNQPFMPVKYFFSIYFLIAFYPLNSQNIWLKGYVGISRAEQLTLIKSLDPDLISIYYRSNAYGFFMPALVVENRRNSNFWEVGFYWAKSNAANNFSALRVPPSDSIQLVDLGEHKFKTRDLQIDYNLKLNNGWGNKWEMFLGFAVNPHWSIFGFKPHQNYIFPMRGSELGVKLGLVPRIQYQLTKNIIVDFNASLSVFSADYKSSTEEDPALTPRQQSNSLIEFDFLNKYAIRFGLAYKIFRSKTEQNN
ncbi:MAG: hypothetical protein ACKVU0_01310 [Saprospiraceae bacterium]